MLYNFGKVCIGLAMAAGDVAASFSLTAGAVFAFAAADSAAPQLAQSSVALLVFGASWLAFSCAGVGRWH